MIIANRIDGASVGEGLLMYIFVVLVDGAQDVWELFRHVASVYYAPSEALQYFFLVLEDVEVGGRVLALQSRLESVVLNEAASPISIQQLLQSSEHYRLLPTLKNTLSLFSRSMSSLRELMRVFVAFCSMSSLRVRRSSGGSYLRVARSLLISIRSMSDCLLRELVDWLRMMMEWVLVNWRWLCSSWLF